jgi:hypothetical protein
MTWNYCELCGVEMPTRRNYFTWGDELNEDAWTIWVCADCVDKTKKFLSSLKLRRK